MARIAIVTPLRDAYSETFIKAHVEGLPAAVTLLYGDAFPTHYDDGELILPRGSIFRRFLRLARRELLGTPMESFRRKGLVKILKAHQVQAVLAEYGPCGAHQVDPCDAAGIPLIVHFHGYDAYRRGVLETYRSKYLRMFEAAAAIVAVSHDMEHQLGSLGAPVHKVHYNPCGIDLAQFRASGEVAQAPTFLAVGRFVDKKGPQLTLAAFAQVVRQERAARLVMMGDGPLLGACQDLAGGLGIAEAVEFTGAAPHGHVAEIMGRARAFVQHSVRASDGDSEGTPVAVLEAQASGLPVVATRHAGIKDVIVEGETGFLVDEHDVDGMADHMLRLAGDASLAERLGRAGRRRVETHFGLERSLKTLWGIIEDAIKTSGGDCET
jgi:glycosyltransferase involved in cell wall biosynthesis